MSNLPLYVTLSGGPENSNPRNSLGGMASVGRGGAVLSQKVHQSGTDNIPGLVAVGGNGVPLGSGTITWDQPNSQILWTDAGAGSDTVALAGDGYYQMSGTSGRFIIWVKGSHLPATLQTSTYVVTAGDQNIFDNVIHAERSANHTNYRCLYVKNNNPQALNTVTLTVDVDPTYGVIDIGTEYGGDYPNYFSAVYAEKNGFNHLGNAIYSAVGRGSPLDHGVEVSHLGGTFMVPYYEEEDGIQITDGLSNDIAGAINDENDSLNELSVITWGNSIVWPTIEPGMFKSFWVRRTITANSSGTALELENFDLRIAYTQG